MNLSTAAAFLYQALVIVSAVLTCIAWRRFLSLMMNRKTICHALPILVLGLAGVAVFMGAGIVADLSDPPVSRTYFLVSLGCVGFGWTAWPASVSLSSQARRLNK